MHRSHNRRFTLRLILLAILTVNHVVIAAGALLCPLKHQILQVIVHGLARSLNGRFPKLLLLQAQVLLAPLKVLGSFHAKVPHQNEVHRLGVRR